MDKNEIKLDKNNNFMTVYGSTQNQVMPSVVYLRTKSKITPTIKKNRYDVEVNDVKNKFAAFVRDSIYKSKSVGNDYLFNIDISSKSVRYGKMSFLRYDLYVKPTKRQALDNGLYRMKQLSMKMDKKLEKLLNSKNFICK